MSDKRKDILEALATLDHEDPKHWTDDGAPLVEVVSELVGSEVTRKEITDAAPNFARGVKGAPEQPKSEDKPEQPKADDIPEPEPKAEDKPELVDFDRAVAEAKQALELAQKAYHEALTTRDNFVRGGQACEYSPEKNQENISAYLARVKKTRMEKAGVTPVASKAPIDRAMNQRKPARGRPTRI